MLTEEEKMYNFHQIQALHDIPQSHFYKFLHARDAITKAPTNNFAQSIHPIMDWLMQKKEKYKRAEACHLLDSGEEQTRLKTKKLWEAQLGCDAARLPVSPPLPPSQSQGLTPAVAPRSLLQ
ncbi:unnamed protein product [Lampetra planeri]